jgi:hypothetical protein
VVPNVSDTAQRLAHERSLSSFLRRLCVRHTWKVLLLAIAWQALQLPSVAGVVVLTGAGAAMMALGGPTGQCLARARDGSVAACGALVAVWTLAQYVVCNKLLRSQLLPAALAQPDVLRFAGVPILQV